MVDIPNQFLAGKVRIRVFSLDEYEYVKSYLTDAGIKVNTAQIFGEYRDRTYMRVETIPPIRLVCGPIDGSLIQRVAALPLFDFQDVFGRMDLVDFGDLF